MTFEREVFDTSNRNQVLAHLIAVDMEDCFSWKATVK